MSAGGNLEDQIALSPHFSCGYGRKKRFAGNTAHKGLVSFIYKELPQIDKKKTANTFLNEQKTYTDTTQKGYLNG